MMKIMESDFGLAPIYRGKSDAPERFAKLTAHLKVSGKPLEQLPPATVRERQKQ